MTLLRLCSHLVLTLWLQDMVCIAQGKVGDEKAVVVLVVNDHQLDYVRDLYNLNRELSIWSRTNLVATRMKPPMRRTAIFNWIHNDDQQSTLLTNNAPSKPRQRKILLETLKKPLHTPSQASPPS